MPECLKHTYPLLQSRLLRISSYCLRFVTHMTLTPLVSEHSVAGEKCSTSLPPAVEIKLVVKGREQNNAETAISSLLRRCRRSDRLVVWICPNISAHLIAKRSKRDICQWRLLWSVEYRVRRNPAKPIQYRPGGICGLSVSLQRNPGF